MEKLAYLGPEWTFSHELARFEYPKSEHVPFGTLAGVVAAVAGGQCETGVIPFYNTTRLSIEESLVAIVAQKNRIFVTDVLPLEVKHHVGGNTKLDAITELRSKKVVYHQVSNWLTKQNLDGVEQKDYTSTSAAVKSIAEDGNPVNVAAIGTLTAFTEYNVPVIKRNIHNKPNVTLFFVLKARKPELADAKRIIMCMTSPTVSDCKAIESTVIDCGCSISSNWPLKAPSRNGTPGKNAYFFEIDGTLTSLGLASATSQILKRSKKAFVLGAYSDKCITRLLWAPNSTTEKRSK